MSIFPIQRERDGTVFSDLCISAIGLACVDEEEIEVGAGVIDSSIKTGEFCLVLEEWPVDGATETDWKRSV